MRKPFKGPVLVVMAFLLAVPASASIIPVADWVHTVQTTLHYWGRLLEIAQKYMQLANQVRQIANEIEQIDNQEQALAKLETFFARDPASTIATMESILGAHDMLSHTQPNVSSAHRQTYPGWSLYNDFWPDEEYTVTATLKTLRKTLEAQHQAHATNRDHLQTLNDLKRQMVNAGGTEQILEVLASIAAYNAEVGTLAQMSDATSADAATMYYSHQINTQARLRKAIHEAFRRSNLEPPELVPGTGWGPLPAWWR